VIYPPEASQKASKQATFVGAEVFNDFIEIYIVKFVHTFLNARTPPSFPVALGTSQLKRWSAVN
jgi:hypothetical protein